MPDVQPSHWVRGAVWALGLGLSIIIAFGSALYSDLRSDAFERYERLEQRVSEISRRKQELRKELARQARTLSGLEEHVYAHDSSANEWKSRIQGAEQRIRDLTTNTASRPDAVTGSEVRVLSGRLSVLETALSELRLSANTLYTYFLKPQNGNDNSP